MPYSFFCEANFSLLYVTQLARESGWIYVLFLIHTPKVKTTIKQGSGQTRPASEDMSSLIQLSN